MISQHHFQHSPLFAARKRWLAGVLLMLLGVPTLLVGGTFGVSKAAIMWHDVQETGVPGYLALRSDTADPYWHNLTPGQQVSWQLEASLYDADSSALELELRSDGQLVHAGHMLVQVSACQTAFQTLDDTQTPTCPSGGVEVLPDTPLASVSQPEGGRIFQLARLYANTPRYLLVTMGMAPDTASQTNAGASSMSIGVGLHASGDGPARPVSAPSLAATGVDATILALLTLGLTSTVCGGYLVKTARERT